MSGMWKRSHGRTSEAPPDERGGYRYVRPTATASHLDSTQPCRPSGCRRTTGFHPKRFVVLPTMAVEGLSGSPGSEVVAQSDRQKLPARIWGPAIADVCDIRAMMQLAQPWQVPPN